MMYYPKFLSILPQPWARPNPSNPYLSTVEVVRWNKSLKPLCRKGNRFYAVFVNVPNKNRDGFTQEMLEELDPLERRELIRYNYIML